MSKKHATRFLFVQYRFLAESIVAKVLISKWSACVSSCGENLKLHQTELRLKRNELPKEAFRKYLHSGSIGLLDSVSNYPIKASRSVSRFTGPVLQRNSDRDKDKDTSTGKTEGDTGKDTNQSGRASKLYDQKEDSFFTQDVAYGSKENKGQGDPDRPVFIPEEEDSKSDEEDLSPPTNCCQSGCPNCVWIDYVEKLSKKFTDPSLTRERIMKDLNGIEDQNIKAFIMMELRTKKLI